MRGNAAIADPVQVVTALSQVKMLREKIWMLRGW